MDDADVEQRPAEGATVTTESTPVVFASTSKAVSKKSPRVGKVLLQGV